VDCCSCDRWMRSLRDALCNGDFVSLPLYEIQTSVTNGGLVFVLSILLTPFSMCSVAVSHSNCKHYAHSDGKFHSSLFHQKIIYYSFDNLFSFYGKS